ncbi:MAG: hypothetical protein AB7D46_00810 [Flavobacteriaceae bacterium]
MSRDKAKIDLDKDYAKRLFLDGNTQKVIAQRLGRTEKTIGKWKEEGKWDDLRKSLLVTKDTQLTSLYNQLDRLNKEIETRAIVYDVPANLLKSVIVKDKDGNEKLEMPNYNPSDFPVKISNTPTSKEADIIAKITSSINKLETETSIGEIVDVAKQIIQFTQSIDLDFAKQLTEYFDLFIKQKMK